MWSGSVPVDFACKVTLGNDQRLLKQGRKCLTCILGTCWCLQSVGTRFCAVWYLHRNDDRLCKFFTLFSHLPETSDNSFMNFLDWIICLQWYPESQRCSKYFSKSSDISCSSHSLLSRISWHNLRSLMPLLLVFVFLYRKMSLRSSWNTPH